jgi:TrmH family RNA methyltransferase
MTAITSRHHPLVKEFRDAARGGDVMLLDGWHLLAEAVAAGVAIETLAVCGPPTVQEQTVIDRARAAQARVVEVSTAVLNAMSPVNSPTGVVATARQPAIDASAVLMPPPALVLAGFGLQDPGNAGAVIRSAAAAGATGVMLDEASADPWGWKALRASMGGVFHLPVIRSRNPLTVLGEWRAAGVKLIAAEPRGGVAMHDMDLTGPVAVLMGGEGPGLPTEALTAADARISIPMAGAVESLNVAVAAALILYEARRQRSGGSSTRGTVDTVRHPNL